MWRKDEWNEFVRNNPSVTDIIREINDYGDIPLECGDCKKKVHDIETKRKKTGKFIEVMVACSSCDWTGWRLLGKQRG